MKKVRFRWFLEIFGLLPFLAGFSYSAGQMIAGVIEHLWGWSAPQRISAWFWVPGFLLWMSFMREQWQIARRAGRDRQGGPHH